MNLLLLKEAKNLYQGLVLQKNKLNAELASTTYQAFIDKSRIQNGLDQIRDIKVLIEREMKILSENLILKKGQVNRLEDQREQSIEELHVLEMALQNQKARFNQNTLRSAKQHETNTHLSATLLDYQNESKLAADNREHIIDKLHQLDLKIKERTLRGDQLKRENITISLNIKDQKLRGKELEDINLQTQLQIDQFEVALDKCRNNTNVLAQYSRKMKALNSNIDSDNMSIQNKLEENKKIIFDTETKLSAADEQFKRKVVENRGLLNDNQSLSVSNHHLHEQNRNLSFQLVNDSKVLIYLEQTNIGLKQLLDEKRIVNTHARSILNAPNKSSVEKGLTRQDSIIKSLGSTGMSFN